jgi:hypothetical protein
LYLHRRLRLVAVVLHLHLIAIDEQPRSRPSGHHDRRGDARLLVCGVVVVHLRLDRGLARDNAIAQLAHGDLGGLHGHASSETMVGSLRIARRTAMAASIATVSTA